MVDSLVKRRCVISIEDFEPNVRDPIDGVVTRAGYNGLIPGAVRPLLAWTLKPIN